MNEIDENAIIESMTLIPMISEWEKFPTTLYWELPNKVENVVRLEYDDNKEEISYEIKGNELKFVVNRTGPYTIFYVANQSSIYDYLKEITTPIIKKGKSDD